MPVIKGDKESIPQFNQAILKYLIINPEVNQRAIETLERLKSGTRAPTVFHFLIDCNGEGTVYGLSYKFEVFPVLFTANFNHVSQVYLNSILSLGSTIQGAVEDLDRLFSSLSPAPGFVVEKNMILMLCPPETFIREQFLDPAFLTRPSEEPDEPVLTDMLAEFIKAVEIDSAVFATISNLRSRGTIFVAVEKETSKIAACTYVTTAQSFSRISIVYTRPDFRRKGLSKALVATAIASLNSWATCTLFVDARNTFARASYTAVGFRPLSTNQVRKLIQ